VIELSKEVLVGDKELGRYFTAVEQQFEESDSVRLLSRGQENNGKALDLAEILRRDDDDSDLDCSVESMHTSTKEYEVDDGDEVRVTELEIEMKKR
jgi:DNA-binding protein Alba